MRMRVKVPMKVKKQTKLTLDNGNPEFRKELPIYHRNKKRLVVNESPLNWCNVNPGERKILSGFVHR